MFNDVVSCLNVFRQIPQEIIPSEYVPLLDFYWNVRDPLIKSSSLNALKLI